MLRDMRLSMVAILAGTVLAATQSPATPPTAPPGPAAAAPTASGVAILQVDTDRRLGTIDRKIYGQFLEHINHSVVDGLFAEQIRGAGFEGKDFATYWTPFGPPGAVRIVEVSFERGAKSVRLTGGRQHARLQQGPRFPEAGRTFGGPVPNAT